MHEKFLEYLCCPKSRGTLDLVVSERRSTGIVETGQLVSTLGEEYPIIRGIPRFVNKQHYAASFGVEWRRWPRLQFEDQNLGGPMEGHTTRMWQMCTGIAENDLSGKVFADFGCGAGRFLDVVRSRGGRVVGMDLSLSVEVARANFPNDPDVLIVQGDVLNPPFRDGVFDGAFSFGVMQHTPDPKTGTLRLTKTVSSGGSVSCNIYGTTGYYSFPSVARMRRAINAVKPVFGYAPAFLYSYFAAYMLSPIFYRLLRTRRLSRITHFIEQQIFPCLYIPDQRWRVLDMFDSITPTMVSLHSGEELVSWLESAGCVDVQLADWNLAAYGKKH